MLLGACSTSGDASPVPVQTGPDGNVDAASSDADGADSILNDGRSLSDASGDAARTNLDVWPDIDSTVSDTVVALVDNDEWTKTLSENDPWWTQGSAENLCEPTDYGPEITPIGKLFDIDTSFCAYLTVEQTLLTEVPVGELFRLKLVQYALTESEGPYLLRLAIGEPAVTVWEMTIEVPNDFQVVDVTWPAARTYLMDEPVYFHLSNHGENTWSFVSLTQEPAQE